MKQNERRKEALRKRKNAVLAIYAGIAVAGATAYLLLGDQPSGPFYNLAYIFGLASYLVLVWLANNIRRSENRPAAPAERTPLLLLFGVIGFVAGVAGAMLLSQLEIVLGYSRGMISVSLFGAVMFAPILMAAVYAIARRSVRLNLDYYALEVYCILAFSKLGCHVNGCCYGVDISATLFGRQQFPVQLCESIATFLIAGFLLWYLLKAKRPICGALYPMGTMLYCIPRFFSEFLRDHVPEHYMFGGLITFWQFLALCCFAASAVWLALLFRREKARR